MTFLPPKSMCELFICIFCFFKIEADVVGSFNVNGVYSYNRHRHWAAKCGHLTSSGVLTIVPMQCWWYFFQQLSYSEPFYVYVCVSYKHLVAFVFSHQPAHYTADPVGLKLTFRYCKCVGPLDLPSFPENQLPYLKQFLVYPLQPYSLIT